MRGYVRILMIGLLLIGLFCGGAMADTLVADFSANDTSGTVPLTVIFTDLSTNATSWQWDVGDGTANYTTQNVTHTYTAAGTYDVALTASNLTDNDTEIKNNYITVTAPTIPVADFSANDTSGTVPLTVLFTDLSTNVTSWQWDVGDGTANYTTQNVTHTYTAAGTYDVALTAINANGSDTETKNNYITVSVGTLPVADFSANDTSGTVPLTVLFTDLSTNVTSWQWDVGDGTANYTTQNVTHTYTAAGTYDVALTAINANGSDTETKNNYITVNALQVPVADISANETEGTVPLSVSFSDQSTGATSWEWDVGDGTANYTTQNVTHTYSSIGTYTVTLKASNANGSSTDTETIKVHSKTYATGDRIWDASATPSLDYTWTALSYSGFYYDLDSGVGSETLTIHLGDYFDRSVSRGDLEYSTQPITTDFEHDDWGSYQVIGFMAEKYFAGYTAANTNFVDDDISMMSKGQLSKILMDDDDRVSAYSGSSLLLEDGYALNIVEVDREGDKVFVLLTKDGSEVDDAIVSSDDEYIYEKDMGSVDDVPIIVVHFRDIFSGIETNAVFVEGIFQISDDYEKVEGGDNYGEMEVQTVNANEITMKNDGSFSLSRGDIIDIMGELKFEVADNSTLRFAPFVDISDPGTYELRGTVAQNEGLEWTTLNFEGFYYNMDEGIGTESLEVTYTGRTIHDEDLVYTTTAQDVSFEYDGASGWSKYNVVGFIGEKYFAGYPAGTFGNSGAVSIMSDGQLSKVLIDDDDKVSLYAGSALILEEGYSLQIVELDRDGSKVFVSLKKDGSEVDEEVVSTDDTYVYEKDLGSSEDVPVIAVHFEEIFSGIETSAVFVEGVFQISDNYLEIESGDTYGEMEVDGISSTAITMINEDSISLSRDDIVDIMEYGDTEIQFKVADSDDVRYYPFVELTIEPTESLAIDMPATVKEDETLTITVTSRGAAVRDVTVKFDGDSIGTTSRDGIVTYEPREAGTFTVTVEKDGYISASGKIEVISPQDETKKMSIVVSPDEVYEGTKVTISTVRSIGGEAIEDAEILYDNNPIGTTSADGTLSYTAKEAGMHKITATRDGFIDAALNLEVLALEADFEFSNLVVSPLEVKAGKDVTITVDVSNDGKAEGEYNVELYINGNVTDSQQIALDVGESTTVEFTHSEDVPGTYEVTIQGLSGTFDVLEKGSSALLYVVGILGVFAVIAAGYMFTAGGWTVEMVTEKVAEFIESIRR